MPKNLHSIARLGLICAVTLLNGAVAEGQGGLLSDDLAGGWRVFTQKQCVRCHGIWDLGGQIGPDLGRTGQQSFTASQLAGDLWNHIPRMHSYMLQNRVEYPRFSLEEMGNLFSFLYFVRLLDDPGDPLVGERVLQAKGCTRCHFTQERSEQSAPDLRRWANYPNSLLWAQKMWQHAPEMERAMKQAGVEWPELSGRDLVNIIAYIRSLGGHEAKVYLRPGSVRAGKQLFSERKCQSCHQPGGRGLDLATADLPRNLVALATRMWNHSPAMSRSNEEAGVERSPLTPQEMADIVAYIFFSSREPGGNAEAGQNVFQRVQCAQCHRQQQQEASGVPSLETCATAATTPVRLAQALWNHGDVVMQYVSDTGSKWPLFQPGEVADLIAYFKAVAPGESQASREPEPASSITRRATPIPLPPIDPRSSCVSNTCHPNILAGPVLHVPAAQGECDACHRLLNPQTHELELVTQTSDLCYGCHVQRVEAMQAHGPVAVSVCTACHDPHGAENLFGPSFTGDEVCFADMIGMSSALKVSVEAQPHVAAEAMATASTRLKQRPDLTTEPERRPSVSGDRAVTLPEPVEPVSVVRGGCVTANCHVGVVSGPHLHPPAAQQQCQACHSLMDEQAHRFTLTATEPALCEQCHDLPGSKAQFVHTPVGLGLCTPCHNPHSAPNRFMLAAPGNELCFMCHTEMATHVKNARVQHKPVTEQGCLVCHNPHGSNFKFQLEKESPELCFDCHADSRSSILASTVDHEPVAACGNCHNSHGSDVERILINTEKNLCLNCHNRPMDTPDGPIIDMKSWIENNPQRHGPIQQDNCTGCHRPHGSKNFRLLEHSFPREFYRPFSREAYALCFGCHEETIVLDARTSTLTAFRNGDKNLHFIHVNREKGRTCRACHEIHAGTKPKRMKDFVPFGEWKYPVNFEQTENGGSCAPGCHVARAYDRTREIVQK